jgi:methionine-rich copper-binding protein CopC
VLALILNLAAPAAAPPAWAHAFLEKASPPVGSEIPVTPPELTLRFTEPVELSFCTVALLNSAGGDVAVAQPRLAPGNPQALVVGLPKLAPGVYTVVWHVTSVDTHQTSGRFSFTIAP